MNFIPHSRAAFQPPSDMPSTGGSGGGRKKLWVGLGIGCGVILVLLGILFAAGAFKAVSCCNTVKDVSQSSLAAQEFALEFAATVARGDASAAYQKTSDAFREETTEEAFKAVVDENRPHMSTNAPRLHDLMIQAGEEASLESLKTSGWRLSYQFAGPTDEEMLLLILNVARVPDAEETTFVVTGVMFDERPRSLAAERPAMEVLELHATLQRGEYEQAYERLAPEFREETSFGAFRLFLDTVGDALTRSTLTIRQVDYNADNTQSTVVAHAQTSGGQNAIIQFELLPMQSNMPMMGWRVVAIAPLITEGDDAPADPAAPGTTEVDAGAAEAPTEDGVEAPSVEVGGP